MLLFISIFVRESITEALISKHKEYARKPQPQLKKMVEKGMGYIWFINTIKYLYEK